MLAPAHHDPAAFPAHRSIQELSLEVEAQIIRSALDVGQWSLHGRRHRAFVLASGGGSIGQNLEETPIAAPSLTWLPKGKAAMLTLRAGSSGAWLAVPDLALGQIALPANMAEDLRRLSLRPQFGAAIDLPLARRLVEALGVIETEQRDAGPGAHEMIRHHLAIVCIALWRRSGGTPVEPLPLPRVIVGNFLQLVDVQIRHHWKVGDYSRRLGVSTDRLNSAVQRATGHSPLSLIHARLLAEARQMLDGSGLQISEIAELLGFEDPAYFSRFFKRLAGKSPRQYRADFALSQARSVGSFAAWP